MQDRFKLRVYDKVIKRYLTDDDVYEITDGILDNIYDLLNDENRRFILGKHDLIFEQCTGMRDYLGKFIYEGDIVKNLRTRNSYYRVVADINDYSFKFVGINASEKISRFEKYAVISNIHEEPELLED